MRIYKIPEHLSCIVFDIDSTLYTHEEYAREQVDIQVRRFADLRGITADEGRTLIANFRGEYERTNGKKISLGNALTHFGIPIEESIRWREELIDPGLFLDRDPRLRSALELLGGKYYLAAVTNNPVKPARATLEALHVQDLFKTLIGLDTTNVSKPHAKPFLMAAQAAGAAPETCLSVGDRFDIDIALPLELGMGGILVNGVEDVYRIPDMLHR